MTVKYRTRCAESEVFVLERDGAYRLAIEAGVNPLSFGNKLADFETMGEAVDAADYFCRAYALFREFGYHLKEDELRKADRNPIPVSRLLRLQLPLSDFRMYLEQTEADAEAAAKTEER